MTEDEAKAALRVVEQELSALDKVIRQEKEAAASAITERYADRRSALLARLSAARADHVKAQDATPDHEWTGRRVYKMVSQGRHWERRPQKRVEGIVETMRSTTALPSNTASYRRPYIGAAIVRLLKKDGTPGAAFDMLSNGSYQPWKLVEAEGEAKAAQVES